MTDRALGRMTMRRNTPRVKRRLQRTDRVAITYTAEEFHFLLQRERKRGRSDAARDRRRLEAVERLAGDRQ
ncbi:hypothetical protein SEA_BBQVALINDRA_62 [Gordonia phage BBQValindra]|nr:hypothetical protein SEA_BBQVALINDRA_62 [Gordonia phage BBQValindra]